MILISTIGSICYGIFISIIDIFNNQLVYNRNKINYVIDIENNIWFKFLSISKLLKYKSSKDALRDLVNKENKSLLIKVENNYWFISLNIEDIILFIFKVGRTKYIVQRLRNYNVGRIKKVELKYFTLVKNPLFENK